MKDIFISADNESTNRIIQISIDVRLDVRYNDCRKNKRLVVKERDNMTAISITQARSNLYKLVADVNASSQPVTITNNRGKNGVLISEDDWNVIQETLYLNSIPGMTESILEAGQEPVSEGTVYDPKEEW